MTPDEIRQFDRIMKNFYLAKSERVERENNALWNIAIDLVTAIADSEADGSGIRTLQEFGLLQAKDLRMLLERSPAAPKPLTSTDGATR